MIINIANLPFINSLSVMFRGCFRCFDRDCTFNEKKTCKDTQEDWVKLYTGPQFLVDFRYAQVKFWIINESQCLLDLNSCVYLLAVLIRFTNFIFEHFPKSPGGLLDGQSLV